MLAAGNFPQHRTLCELRRRHLKDFRRLFVQVVVLAREIGMVELGRLGIDGTKVRANASRRKAMSYGRMREREKQLKAEIDGLLEEVEESLEETPKQVLADAGYCNEADLQALEERGVDGYVALGREGKQAVEVNPGKYPARSRMRQKLASLAGQVEYRRRKWIAEAPHGWIKERLGFRRFSLRGLQSVQGEWDLVCLALNIKRMSALMTA